MRLPLIAPLESRDGVSNRDARFTNMLAETNDAGVMIAVKRPGLVNVASPTGTAQGLCEFDGELISIYNATLGKSTATVTETLSPTLGGATTLYPSSGNARKGDLFLSVGGYTGGVFGDTVRYSFDGVTWASYSDGGWGNTDPYGPALFADDTYFYAIISIISLTQTKVYRSTDGSSWTLMQTLGLVSFRLWDDGLYYYDGASVYRSTDSAGSFALVGTNSGTYDFPAPICSTTIDGGYYIYDLNGWIAYSADKITFNVISTAPGVAVGAYEAVSGCFVGRDLFFAAWQDATHCYVVKMDPITGDYVFSSVIGDQPISYGSGYTDYSVMFSDDTYVFLPGDTGVWKIPVQETRTTTITTIASVAGDEIFDFAQSPL